MKLKSEFYKLVYLIYKNEKETPRKTQTISNVVAFTKEKDYAKAIKIKGKVLQKLICETKFKRIQTETFPSLSLDHDTTAAVIELGKGKCDEEIKGNQYKIPVYKHLIKEGYKFRPIQQSTDTIAIMDSKGNESCLRIVDLNDNIGTLKIPLDTKQSIESNNNEKQNCYPFEQYINTANAPNELNGISLFGVVQPSDVVFLSCKQCSLFSKTLLNDQKVKYKINNKLTLLFEEYCLNIIIDHK